MSITVTSAIDDLGSWDEHVARSSQATPFHQAAGVQLLADHTGTTLHPLVGFKGDQPVGVFPVFEQRRGPITTVVSPPKRTEVYYLGPILTNVEQLKQRTYERRNDEFVRSCLDWIDEHIGPDHCHISTVDRYVDHRPFKADGYEITPYYTYVVDLTREWDDLVMEFSSDARSNVRNTAAESYDIEVGGLDEARTIIDRVLSRHAEQGEPYYITREYVDRLLSTFPDGQVTPYVCRTSAGLAGGILTIEYGDTIYRWQGGTKPVGDLPVNDLLDAHIMRDAMDRGLERYDLVGANTPRLCAYKSKFAPELRTYYGARKRSRRGRLISTVRRSVPIDV